MAKLLITGFSESRGVSKQGKGSPYAILRLLPLVPIRGWSNDNGQSVGVGVATDDNKSFSVMDKPELIARLKAVNYPAYIELVKTDDPTDPTRTVVSDFKVFGEPVATVLTDEEPLKVSR